MLKNPLKILPLLFTLAFTIAAQARTDEGVVFPVDKDVVPLQVVCGVKKSVSGRQWKYCAHVYANSSRKVMYYFHGMNGNERSWRLEGFERKILKRWVEKGEQPPIVVSVSFGPTWLMVEKNSSKLSGIYEIFMNEIVPTIQNQVLRIQAEENWLMGVSMGGFNASQVYFKNPGFFTRAAIVCAAMTIVSPFDGKDKIHEYRERTHAKDLWVTAAMNISKDYLPTKEDWLRESPITQAISHFSPQSTPLYISNGTSDGFGFHEGDIIFGWIAKFKGAPIEQNFYAKKGHCEVDPLPIADYLARPMVQPDSPVTITDLPDLPPNPANQ
jgi:S-formylglutathione hydrolase FrmB